jgi:hypothetical protein
MPTTRQVTTVLHDVSSCSSASSFSVEQRHAADKVLMSNVVSVPQAMGATFLSRFVAAHRAVHTEACDRHLGSLPAARKRVWAQCIGGTDTAVATAAATATAKRRRANWMQGPTRFNVFAQEQIAAGAPNHMQTLHRAFDALPATEHDRLAQCVAAMTAARHAGLSPPTLRLSRRYRQNKAKRLIADGIAALSADPVWQSGLALGSMNTALRPELIDTVSTQADIDRAYAELFTCDPIPPAVGPEESGFVQTCHELHGGLCGKQPHCSAVSTLVSRFNTFLTSSKVRPGALLRLRTIGTCGTDSDADQFVWLACIVKAPIRQVLIRGFVSAAAAPHQHCVSVLDHRSMLSVSTSHQTFMAMVQQHCKHNATLDNFVLSVQLMEYHCSAADSALACLSISISLFCSHC